MKYLLIFFLLFDLSFSRVLNKNEIRDIIVSSAKNSNDDHQSMIRTMTIKDFASLVSSNDNVNIMMSDNVDASTVIYMNVKQDKLLPAFRSSLSMHNYKLTRRNGFYIVEKDNNKVLRSWHRYQLRSDVYDQIKPLLDGFKHNYVSSSNRLLIRCSDEEYRSLSGILRSVDRLKKTFNIKVTVFDIDSSILDSQGFDVSAMGQFTSGQVSYYLDLLRVTQTKSLPYLGDSKFAFYGFVDFLSSHSLAKIEVSTIVNTVDGVKSNIENVTRVPILRSTTEIKETNTKNTNSYDYQDIGSLLSIEPHYIDKRTVSLDFTFSYSSLSDSVRSVEDGSQYLPTYNEKKINSVIRLRRGQAVLVGGFRRINRSTVDNSIPYLSDVPVFGNLFRLNSQKSVNVVTYIIIEYMGNSLNGHKVRRVVSHSDDSRKIMDLF